MDEEFFEEDPYANPQPSTSANAKYIPLFKTQTFAALSHEDISFESDFWQKFEKEDSSFCSTPRRKEVSKQESVPPLSAIPEEAEALAASSVPEPADAPLAASCISESVNVPLVLASSSQKPPKMMSEALFYENEGRSFQNVPKRSASVPPVSVSKTFKRAASVPPKFKVD